MQTTADNSTSAYGVYIILCSYPPYVSTEGYISCWFFSLPGYRYLGDGDADRREIFQDGTYRSRIDLLPFLGR